MEAMKTDVSLDLPPDSSARRWHGAIEGLCNGLLYGWALDRGRPHARVVVEICLDGVPRVSATADVARTDLAQTFTALHPNADVCHGFVADLKSLPEGMAGILSARVANLDVMLPGSFALDDATVPPPPALSLVWGDGGLRLFGWAVDPLDPRSTTTVRAYIGEEMVAQATADLMLPAARAYVEGAHGFDLALPATLADGRTHSVRVMDDNGVELNGSPVLACCALDGMAALLPADTDKLTLELAAMYERRVPRSLPMNAWPQWSARFDQAPPEPLPAAVASFRTAVLITGEPDARAIERTRASLERQGVAIRVFTASPFSALLAEALSAGCDVIACIRAGDTLAPAALAHALAGFALPHARVVYTDSEQDGTPWFKPAWDPDYALATDYPLELLLVHRSVAQVLPRPDSQAQFAWSSLASAWAHGEQAIVHVPRVLYQVNSPFTEQERAGRAAAAARAIRAMEPAVALDVSDRIAPDLAMPSRRVRAALPPGARELIVSLVIPTRDRADLLKRCIDSIERFTAWPSLEIIVIDNGSVEQATHDYFAEIAQHGVRIMPMPGPFNYADLNNRAVALATGDIVGLVNNDIEALHDGWLEEIVAQLSRPGVGAVGAKLLWPNGMVQHGGVLVGVGNAAGHFGNLLADADWGDHGRNQLVHRVSGCTAACLFLRRQDYLELGGMDALAFPVAFNDVDLCLRMRASGKAIIWTPHAKLLHAESASRGNEDTPQKRARARRETEQLRRRWGPLLLQDPAYHPSLSLDPNSHAFGGLALPPRPRVPRTGALVDFNAG
ncbi:glycosyltransferase family 2 protein [Massilia sp. METH4]|uniref:glycosyltransferase family 2 protein n=1 Tax=Massilia sp. METH4 TaxID=3123041 RepID=UPI0030CCAACF